MAARVCQASAAAAGVKPTAVHLRGTTAQNSINWASFTGYCSVAESQINPYTASRSRTARLRLYRTSPANAKPKTTAPPPGVSSGWRRPSTRLRC
eukprot:5126318-Prymnesium_polylepis.2